MNNNDVLHSILQTLKLDAQQMSAIFALNHHTVSPANLSGLIKGPAEAGYLECSDLQLGQFLDGLISYRRGQKDNLQQPSSNEATALNNNIIVKKLRIAFDLKEDDLIELMSLTDYEISKSELSAIFRKPGNKHYRACSEEFLTAFLEALSLKQWS